MFVNNSSTYSLRIQGGHFWEFTISTIIILLLTFFLSKLVPTDNAKMSLLSFLLVSMIPIWLYSKILLKDTFCSNVLVLASIIKGGIGFFVYIAFIDPEYFSHPSSVAISSVNDFNSMFLQIGKFVDGFDFSYKSIKDNAMMRHPEIYAIMSVFYKNAGNYLLTIIPINVICSSFVATMVAYITRLRKGNYRVVAFLCAFFPMSLMPSYFFRDLVGLLFVTIFLTLVVLSRNHFFKIVLLIVTSYVFSLQREPYIIIPLLAYCISLFLNSSRSKGKIFAIVFGVFAILFGSDFIIGSFEDQETYMGTAKNLMFYVLFPLRFLQCIIGPFPWTQIFNRPEFIYQVQDWFMSAALFYLLFKIFPIYLSDLRNQSDFDYLSIVGLLIMLMGITSSTPHLTYVSFGVCFMVPMISRVSFSMDSFVKFNIKYFFIMGFASVIWTVLGFGGIAKIFK